MSIASDPRLSNPAHASLLPPSWYTLYELTKRTAQMLMKIAADPRLTNTEHVRYLPNSWGTLYELTKRTE